MLEFFKISTRALRIARHPLPTSHFPLPTIQVIYTFGVESLALLVSILLLVGIAFPVISYPLSIMLIRRRSSKLFQPMRAVIALALVLAIFIDITFMLGDVRMGLKIFALGALFTSLLTIKNLFTK